MDGRLTRCLARVKNKFRSSNKKKPEASPEMANIPSGSTVASAAGAQSGSKGRDRSTASGTRPDIQAKPDLWQEALDKAQQSTDWKSHKEEYDEAVRECHGINQNALNNNNSNGESTCFADAISNHLSSLRERALEKQWGYESSNGEKIYFRDVITRIVQWVNVFKDSGNQLAGLDPTKAASFVWGFVQFFVEVSVFAGYFRFCD